MQDHFSCCKTVGEGGFLILFKVQMMSEFFLHLHIKQDHCKLNKEHLDYPYPNLPNCPFQSSLVQSDLFGILKVSIVAASDL